MSLRNQRWRERRATFRPGAEVIDPTRYGVEPIDSDRLAADFVKKHHYSGSFPSARVRVGLYRQRQWFTPELVGIAVFGTPASEKVLPKWTGQAPREAVELSRFVLLDDVEGNGETWFLSRAFRVLEQAKPEVRAVLAFSDPVARVDEAGETVTPGHIGAIYQSFSGRFVGRADASLKVLAPDGRDVTKPLLDKIRQEKRGRDYAMRALTAWGAPARRPGEEGAAYVARALVEGPFRRYRHPGNLAYVWPLAHSARRVLPAEQPRPTTLEIAHAA